MDLLNFKIKDSIYFITNEYCLDLHNDYNCYDFIYNFKKQKITISWNRGHEEWVPNNIPSSLKLVIDGVLLVKTKPRNSKYPFSDDDCIESIGFVNKDIENDGLNGIIEDDQSNMFNVFCIWFQSDFCLYIDAKSAKLEII